MLKLHRAKQGTDRLVREIARTLCFDEVCSCERSSKGDGLRVQQVVESIMSGLASSVFEGVFKTDLATKSSNGRLAMALDASCLLLAKLPRLVYLVRDATQPTCQHDRITAVVEEALWVFHSNTDEFVRETIAAHIQVLEARDIDSAPPSGTVFEFASQTAFAVAAQYYVHRTIICGILQTLLRGHDDFHSLDLAAVQRADIEAATSIAMCVRYALEPRPSKLFTALKILFPLQMGVGSWLRLQRRQSSGVSPDAMYAAAMIHWTYDRVDEIGLMWRYTSGRLDMLAKICDMYAGGPFIPNRGRSI